MVFKRRDSRSWATVLRELVYPRGGWMRAFEYVKHRVRRLPDRPEKIARGIWAGVFTTFTPFYGLHFIVAGTIAFFMRGNVIAALLATFFGNPLTYVPIGIAALQTGHFLLGTRPRDDIERSLGGKFVDAGADLWHNFQAVFTDDVANWERLSRFWSEVFFPYLIGGIIPGVIVATLAYYLSVPVIRAYQNRRKGRLAAKIQELKDKTVGKAEDSKGH
ncbi:MAG: DUF2062 domain-containing protein [Pseudomonadota bacterium]